MIKEFNVANIIIYLQKETMEDQSRIFAIKYDTIREKLELWIL